MGHDTPILLLLPVDVVVMVIVWAVIRRVVGRAAV
jgi:hypothetical protein